MQKPLEPPRHWLARWKAWLMGVFTVTVLTLTIFPANFIQCLTVTLWPFSRRLFRRANEVIAGSWWALCLFFMKNIHKTRLIITGDPVPKGESALVMANHQQMPDIAILMALAQRQNRLGQLKWFVKDILKFVPGVGWGMAFLGCLFVKRDWVQDSPKIKRQFQKMRENRLPVWPIIFLEGTRITKEKLRKGQNYARKMSLPFPRHVLPPRTKGLVATVTGLRDHLRAVYDVTLAYPKGVPNLWQFAQGLCREIHVDIRRFPLPSLPVSGPDLEKWAIQRFHIKDNLLHHFYQEGQFPPSQNFVQ